MFGTGSEKRCSVPHKLLAKLESAGLVAAEQSLEFCTALDQRRFPQIFAVQVKQVEGVEDGTWPQ